MSRKSTVRDNVNGVRARLPELSDLPRGKVELAPLHHQSNVESTVDAFARSRTATFTLDTNAYSPVQDGPTEASTKRENKNPRNRDPPASSPTVLTPSTSVLRPSQRVSNIFQNFAGGSSSTVKTNGRVPTGEELSFS